MTVMAVVYIYYYRKDLQFNILDIAVIIFFGYFLIRNITGAEYAKTIKYLILGLGTIYFTALTTKIFGLFKILVMTILFVTCITAIYGFFEYVLQDSVFSYVDAPGLHRVGSFFSNPVIYGAFLVQALPFCVLFIIRPASFSLRIFSIISTLWASLALLLTYSKGSWLSMGIISLFFLAWFILKSRTKKLVYLIIIAGLAGTTTLIFWNQIRYEALERKISYAVRSHLWLTTIEAIPDNLFLGVGFHNGAQSIQQYLEPGWQIYSYPIDNFFLNVIYELGVVGLILWLLFLSIFIGKGIMVAVRNQQERVMVVAALTSIIGIIINSVTYDAFLHWPNLVLFWIALGMIRGFSSTEPGFKFR